jgi:hypothetical protein
METLQKITQATCLPKHHLFGFHDLVAFNRTGEKLLTLEADVINRPPLPGERFGVGYTLWEEQRFISLGTTTAMNYPQGARQQWLNNHQFIVNNQVGNHWGANIYDVENGTQIAMLDSTAHCVTQDGRYAFGINYSRLHRLGGYGYIGIADPAEQMETPTDDGIYITEIHSNRTRLLVSIAEVAHCDEKSSASNGFHHYLTHPVLSPDNRRIAFLHRFFLSDGGIRTRLMTIGVDGTNLRCLGFGFLSHFDWKDNETLYIWGRTGKSIDAVRSHPLFSHPFVRPMLGIAKKVVRKCLSRSQGMTMSFLLIKDQDEPNIQPVASGIITEDGHPMCCPTHRDTIICDTYPNAEKCRTLFTYRFTTNQRTDIGQFRMWDEQPDTHLFTQYTQGVDAKVLSMMSADLFSFTRSGLHCDLHPRWDAQGKKVAFDSIHEGSRQIYIYHHNLADSWERKE